MSIKEKIDFICENLYESESDAELDHQTFSDDNENILCFMETNLEQHYQLYDENKASCNGVYCREKVLSKFNLKTRLNKLKHGIGQDNKRFEHIDECIICVRHKTANYINIYNNDPERAKNVTKRNTMVFDLKDKIGGYNNNHMTCFSDPLFHLGSKNNEYDLSMDHSTLVDLKDSIYRQPLN